MNSDTAIKEAIAQSSRDLLTAADALGRGRWASQARAWCVPYLFSGMERVFASNVEPLSAVSELFAKLARFLREAAGSGINRISPESDGASEETAQSSLSDSKIEKITGEHYGRLFREFSRTSYWDEPVRLLRTRLERNEIDLSRLPEQEVLDTGCGGGRYTVAWRLLGAKRAVGVDISPIGIASAQQRVDDAGLDGVSFEEGSVLDLPFPDCSFDIVFSNGVLHHTVDWEKGMSEMVRVLRPGGMGWLYLIENPGGIFWSLIEALRELMKDEDRESARVTLQMLGIPDNRVFYLLDHVMAPINLRLTPEEIERSLRASGATRIRRLTRGADFDRIEQIYRQDPFAEVKYGVGENRYVFTKG